MTTAADEIVGSMEFELTELDEALKAFFTLLLDEYTHIQSNGEPRPVPYEVAYTLAGKMRLDHRSLRDKWNEWHRLRHSGRDAAS